MLTTYNLPKNNFHDYHRLTAYQKAKILTKQIIKLSSTLPHNSSSLILINQIIRSSSSIGTNIVEGYGRNSKKEYKQFLKIARVSSFETEYWLEIIQDSYNLNLSDIINLNKEIIRLLTTTIKKLS